MSTCYAVARRICSLARLMVHPLYMHSVLASSGVIPASGMASGQPGCSCFRTCEAQTISVEACGPCVMYVPPEYNANLRRMAAPAAQEQKVWRVCVSWAGTDGGMKK